MKNVTIFFVTMLIILSLAHSSKAALHDRGSGLVYDDIQDITWMQSANYAGLTMTWDNAAAWAENLVFQGYNDWRLPVSDPSCTGKSCTGSEMGSLYYDYAVTSDTPGIFSDVKSFLYWSDTEDSADPSSAWRFSFKYGTQDLSPKTSKRYAWAVREGDSGTPVAPEPISSLLFLTGGATLGLKKLRKRT